MIIFDMDGVLFKGRNFWLDLHRAYGTEKDALELADTYLHTARESDYVYLSKYTAKFLWKGKSASAYYELIRDRTYHPGIHKLLDYIHKRELRTAVISSGAYDLALRAQSELGIDTILANKLTIKDSVLTGDVEVMVPDNSKDRVGKKLMWKLNIKPNTVAFVGDTASDISIAQLVGLPISYDSTSEKLRTVCKFNLNYGEIEKLIDILKSPLPKDSAAHGQGHQNKEYRFG